MQTTGEDGKLIEAFCKKLWTKQNQSAIFAQILCIFGRFGGIKVT